MTKTAVILQVFLIILHLSVYSCNDEGDSNSKCTNEWSQNAGNPLINYNDAINEMLWNDPCVIKEGNTYRMWLSGGLGYGINNVRIYEASSTDGIDWNIDTTVLLEPNSDITVTYSGTVPGVAGTYKLVNVTDAKPTFKHETNDFYIWYYPTESSYFLSDVIGAGAAYYWKIKAADGGCNGGASPDGTYEVYAGSDGEPVAATEWDSEKVETPMVIKVGSTYHLYYSGFKTGDAPGKYQMGHATSPDGRNWTKDPGNPVIAYHDDNTKWGYYQAAEPGAVYHEPGDTIYLYYVTAKNRDGYTGNQALFQGICLGTSPGSDGSNFTHYDSDNDGNRDPVRVQSENYNIDDNYVGYSTPFPLIDDQGTFHLFYDVVRYPQPDDWRQVALAHSTGPDGTAFTEIEHDIFVIEEVTWLEHEVRAPCVMQEGDILKMWFAGTGDPSLFFTPDTIFAIGYAEYGANCL